MNLTTNVLLLRYDMFAQNVLHMSINSAQVNGSKPNDTLTLGGVDAATNVCV